MKKNIRIFFSKTGRAVYISHLDLYRLFQRAMKRCRLPVWETEGFNPHIYITFALPLSLGISGECESLDTALVEELSFDEVRDRLNTALPRDIRIIRAGEPVYKPTEIESSVYEADFECDNERFEEFLSQEHIIVEKKTKRGITELDLKEHLDIREKGAGHLKFSLPSGNELNINAGLLFDAYESFAGEEMGVLNIKRAEIRCKNGEIFR